MNFLELNATERILAKMLPERSKTCRLPAYLSVDIVRNIGAGDQFDPAATDFGLTFALYALLGRRERLGRP